MHAILEAVFPSRIRAVKALLGATTLNGAEHLSEAESELRETLALINDPAGQADWQSLTEAVSISAKLEKWYWAVRTAEPDADRFLRAARLQFAEWRTAKAGYSHDLRSRFSTMVDVISPADVASILAEAARLRFPVRIFTDEPTREYASHGDEVPAKAELAVAFLEFRINGEEATSIHRLAADRLHDLELKIRVSRWPDAADRLVVKPVSLEPDEVWSLPEFEFSRPSGEPPFTLELPGRLAIRQRVALGARPLEFIYAAEFQPIGVEQPVAVAGQRSLRLDSSEASDHLETGYPSLDTVLLNVRTGLRYEPRVPDSEIGAAVRLFKPLANLVGQALQDNIFPDPIDEATFENHIKRHLRSHPEVGVELEVQAQAGRGRTDLSFRQLRIELKVKNDAALANDEIEKYALQAAAYAVSSDKSLALLCILDGSPKKGSPITMPECIRIVPVQPGDRPVYVITFIMQGNLAKPSSLSR